MKEWKNMQGKLIKYYCVFLVFCMLLTFLISSYLDNEHCTGCLRKLQLEILSHMDPDFYEMLHQFSRLGRL